MSFIITFDNAAEKAAGIGALANRVDGDHVKRWGEEVAEVGESTIRGLARVKTGAMSGSVSSRSTGGGGTAFAEAGYGVTSGEPFYTIFQEGGTSRGITPMLSVPAGAMAMEKAASDRGEAMLARIAGEWNAI